MSSTKQRQEAAKQARKAAKQAAKFSVMKFSLSDEFISELFERITTGKSSNKNKDTKNVLLVAKVAAKRMIANNVELDPSCGAIDTKDAMYYQAAINTLKKMNVSLLTIEKAFVEHDEMILSEFNIDMNKHAGVMAILNPQALADDLKKLPKQVAYESAVLNAVVSHMCNKISYA
jgi:Mg2+ and Co2+ transporter CorA